MDTLEVQKESNEIKNTIPQNDPSLIDQSIKLNPGPETLKNYNNDNQTFIKDNSFVDGGFNRINLGFNSTFINDPMDNYTTKKSYVPDPGLNLEVEKDLHLFKEKYAFASFDRNNLNISKDCVKKNWLSTDSMLFGQAMQTQFRAQDQRLKGIKKESNPSKVVYDANLPRDFISASDIVLGSNDIEPDMRFIDQDDLLDAFSRSKFGNQSKFAVDKQNELVNFDPVKEHLKMGPELENKKEHPDYGVTKGGYNEVQNSNIPNK